MASLQGCTVAQVKAMTGAQSAHKKKKQTICSRTTNPQGQTQWCNYYQVTLFAKNVTNTVETIKHASKASLQPERNSIPKYVTNVLRKPFIQGGHVVDPVSNSQSHPFFLSTFQLVELLFAELVRLPLPVASENLMPCLYSIDLGLENSVRSLIFGSTEATVMGLHRSRVHKRLNLNLERLWFDDYDWRSRQKH